jgi:glycine cleavage system aminomethyltransferase T
LAWTEALGEETLVARQGVTGEIGYEFFFPVESGKSHELWREIREVGREYGLRELGFRAQMIGHTEINLATAIRDYGPARMPAARVRRFAEHCMSHEEAAALDWDPEEHFCTPYELGWGSLIDLDSEFYGHDALRETAASGPDIAFVGLEWTSDDVLGLFGEQFDAGEIAPPLELPAGQFRIEYLRVRKGGECVGWASGHTYSPNLRKMLSNARIPVELAEQGTEVDVVWGGFTPEDPKREVRATVEPRSFVQSKERNDPRP